MRMTRDALRFDETALLLDWTLKPYLYLPSTCRAPSDTVLGIERDAMHLAPPGVCTLE